MKCKHVEDRPNTVNGNVVWKRVPCKVEAEDGERYCKFHKKFHQVDDKLDDDWLKKLHD